MHRLKRIYCRAFQKGMRIALPFLPYRKPVMLNGIPQIPEALEAHKCKKVLVVTDRNLIEFGVIAPLKKTLEINQIPYVIYGKVVANPTTDNVEEALALYQEAQCDSIIGFGGGSSIDCAKAVGARVAKPKKTLKKLKGIMKVRRRIPLLIAIPTTAGTGSEATVAAVIVDSETRHKYAINDFPLIPKYAVLDPRVTASLPPSVTATTGMDALTHAVEAYIGNSTTPGTRKDALRAVELIFKNIDIAYNDGTYLKSRRNMLVASYYAGCAFSKSYVGYVHAIAHSLGGEYNVAHGLANSILLPDVLEAYGPCIHKKLHKLAIAAGLAKKATPHDEAAEKFIQAIRDMQIRFHIPNRVKELREEDIPKLAAYADKEANPLYPVPVLMNAKELEQFYYKVLTVAMKKKVHRKES